jgi:hypothetical protein
MSKVKKFINSKRKNKMKVKFKNIEFSWIRFYYYDSYRKIKTFPKQASLVH